MNTAAQPSPTAPPTATQTASTTGRTAPMSHTLTVPVADLYLLLADLVETAATDDTLPMLCGVLLHTDTTPTGQRVLVGTSTDRFVLGQAHTTDITGELPDTFMPLGGARAMLAALDTWWGTTAEPNEHDEHDQGDGDGDGFGDPLPASHQTGPHPTGGVTARLVRNPDALTLVVPMAATVCVRVELPDVEFPTQPLARLLTEPTTEPTTGRAAGPTVAATVGLAPELWRMLGRIAERRDTAITLTPPTTRALRVHIGDQYRALVMPLRPDRMCPPPPVFLPTDRTTRTRVQD